MSKIKIALKFSFIISLWMKSSATFEVLEDPVVCKDLRPQNGLDVSHTMGIWYGVELISHLKRYHDYKDYDTCVVVEIVETTRETSKPDYNGHSLTGGTYQDIYQSESDPGADPLVSAAGHAAAGAPRLSDLSYRHLRLLWEEPGNDIEYNLKFNASRRGFWMASGPHNAPVGRLYDSFAGVIQVLKAVGDHMVLTVCQVLPERQLHSIVLARHPAQLSREDIHGVHNLLARKDLSTSSVRKLCSSSGHKVAVSGILFAVVAAFLFRT